MLVDTHAHLQWRSFDKDREDVITRAQKADVKGIVNIGFDVMGSRKAVKLAEKHDNLYATVGVHPHNANQLNDSALKELQRLSSNRKVVAIGETGLDYYRNLSPREVQKMAFEAQLCLAQQLELPVVIHSREASSDILQTLSKYRGKIRGVMHCFSGSELMAKQCMESGFYISFAGPVTFPNANRLHRLAGTLDSSRILLETDSPWLAPQEVRGKRNEPAFLEYIARKVAGLRKTTVEELGEITARNASEIFQLS